MIEPSLSGIQQSIRVFLLSVEQLSRNPLDFRFKQVHDRLHQLRQDYSALPSAFSEQNVQMLREAVNVLDALVPIKSTTCPTCYGSGTQRWMYSYKHGCGRCEGSGRVEETTAAVQENEWNWQQSDSLHLGTSDEAF